MGSVDAAPADLEAVRRILREHAPELEVRAFGSRVSWTARETSDLDLALMTNEPLDAARMAVLRSAFTDSRLPFRVDVVDWAGASDSFRKVIESEYVTLVGKPGRDTGGSWPTAPLGQVTELTLSSVDKKTKPHEHAVLLCNYMDVYSNRFIRSDLEFMTATATEREIRRCALRPGDVVITKDSEQYDDIGVPALVRDDIGNLVCGYHLAILRPLRESICGHYLLYALQIENAQHQFHAYANGVTRFGLRKDDILRVEISLPPLPEQRAIASVLGALDDKIDLNRRMNETLEAMARALFKSWFVDFSPVRAKAEGRDTGLPDHIADLFPDRLVDSELGEIPEGWHSGTLDDIVSLNPQSWNTRNVPETVVYVDLANTKWGCIERVDVHPWGTAPSRARRVLRPGDTIVGTVRPGNGSFALIGRDGLTGSTGFAVLRPKASHDREIVWCTVTSRDNIERLAHLADGGAYPAVRPRAVAETPVVLTDVPVRRAFSLMTAPWFDLIENNRRESQRLVSLRDMTLPKLVSGELRLGEAVKRLESAA